MRKIIATLIISTGMLAACDSNKGNRSSEKSTAVSTAHTKPQPAKVSQPAEPVAAGPKTRLDSLLETSGWDNSSAGSSRRPSTNFQGASGAGTGGTYASSAYAKEAYKKKAVAKKVAVVDSMATNTNNNTINADTSSVQPTW